MPQLVVNAIAAYLILVNVANFPTRANLTKKPVSDFRLLVIAFVVALGLILPLKPSSSIRASSSINY